MLIAVQIIEPSLLVTPKGGALAFHHVSPCGLPYRVGSNRLSALESQRIPDQLERVLSQQRYYRWCCTARYSGYWSRRRESSSSIRVPTVPQRERHRCRK